VAANACLSKILSPLPTGVSSRGLQVPFEDICSYFRTFDGITFDVCEEGSSIDSTCPACRCFTRISLFQHISIKLPFQARATCILYVCDNVRYIKRTEAKLLLILSGFDCRRPNDCCSVLLRSNRFPRISSSTECIVCPDGQYYRCKSRDGRRCYDDALVGQPLLNDGALQHPIRFKRINCRRRYRVET